MRSRMGSPARHPGQAVQAPVPQVNQATTPPRVGAYKCGEDAHFIGHQERQGKEQNTLAFELLESDKNAGVGNLATGQGTKDQ